MDFEDYTKKAQQIYHAMTREELDPRQLFLQPECCAADDTGRLWCEHDAPIDCEDGKPWVRYIRADLVAEAAGRVTCKKCAGHGDLLRPLNSAPGYDYTPCPDCAPLRALLAKLEGPK